MIKLFFVALSFFTPQEAARDSVGTETINGKVFVIHKVGEKETLYAISKRYGTTVDAILQYNPNADGGLSIGQVLKVPYVKRAVVARPTTGGGIIHVVTGKETLFSISKAYNVSIDEIKQWNNLTANGLSVGQELTIRKRNTVGGDTSPSTSTTISVAPQQTTSRKGYHVVAAKETMYSISRQYGITVQQLKEWNNLQDISVSVGQTLFVTQPAHGMTPLPADNNATATSTTNTVAVTTPVKQPDPEPVKDNPQPVKEVVQPPVQTITITEGVRGNDEIAETGIAELIEGTEGNRKYLALHRTAPVGSILKVRNELNNREVFVRVMGKLPETLLTEKVIIRISKSAYDRLGAFDQRFRVQVTYYK